MINLGDVDPGEVLYCPFATYNSSGASVTITGLATTDIEIYKDGSVTQRASDAGYALLDTDGIDFDGITGIHGFSVDLGDNTTAGFYTAGSTYFLVVSAITVDSQTVNFVYRFRIRADVVSRGTLSGTHSSTTADLGTLAPANDISGQTVYFPSHGLSRVIDSYNTGTGVATFSPSVAVTLANGELWVLYPSAPASTGAPPAVNVTQISGDATAADNAEAFFDGTGYAGTNNVIPTVTTTTTATNLTNLPAITANWLTAAGTAADFIAEINAQVVDGLAVDTYAEPGQGAPAATTTLAAKVNYLYKAWRNRSTQTATEYALYADDATTKDQEAAVSSDGTTLDRGEVGTGA